MLGALIFLVFNLAVAAPRFFVPPINTLDVGNNGFLLEPSENQYNLTIRDGGNIRQETVAEVASDQLQVKGQQEQYFDGNGYLKVAYEAGTNGNVVKYIYRTTLPITGYALPVAVLKSGAG